MFGPEYFTVGGYLIDGGILCRACGEARDLPASASVTEAEIENACDPEGEYCSDCTGEIVAPVESE